MAVKRKSTIRKQHEEESFQEVPLNDAQLEMLSEEENEDLVSDDGLVDDFPELNVQSDSSGSETGHSSAEDDDDSAENSDDSESSVNSLHLVSKPKNVVSDITHQPKLVYPEIIPGYDSDSSTEDVGSFLIYLYEVVNMILKAPNRIGNVPSHWYDDLPHIGYDINGKQLLRPALGDELDKFLATVENPSAWSVSSDNLGRSH
jgi:ribosome biogenesis protein ERB1